MPGTSESSSLYHGAVCVLGHAFNTQIGNWQLCLNIPFLFSQTLRVSQQWELRTFSGISGVRLNAFVSQKFICWNPNVQYDDISRQGLWEMLKWWKWNYRGCDQCLIKEAPERSLALPPDRNRARRCQSQARKRALTRKQQCWYLDLGWPIHFCYLNYPVSGILLLQPQQTETPRICTALGMHTALWMCVSFSISRNTQESFKPLQVSHAPTFTFKVYE